MPFTPRDDHRYEDSRSPHHSDGGAHIQSPGKTPGSAEGERHAGEVYEDEVGKTAGSAEGEREDEGRESERRHV